MRCPYYHIDLKDGKKQATCSLFNSAEVMWDTDCKKCITDRESRFHAWQVSVGNIRENMFSLIPDEWHPIGYCEYQGEPLVGVFETVKCCGGKTKQVQKIQCLKEYKAVTQKECFECQAKKSQN